MKLNLEAKNPPQQRIKDYLEQSASTSLADKINNGTPTQDNLINKKTLDGFMKYATEEARRLAEKGSMCACVEDSVVFGWAVHYFEEESIIEKLYNADGTEYVKPEEEPKKKAEVKKPASKPIETKKSADTSKKIIAFDKQMSLFDF